MRVQILIYLFLIIILSAKAQTKFDVFELCDPTKLRPYGTDKESKLFLLDAKIDTVSFEFFLNQCSNLLSKMRDTLQLTCEEDYFLIKIINTYKWLEWDKQNWLTKSNFSLNQIFNLYESLYWRYLRCKYTVIYFGGIFYEELDIIDGSTPGRSSRLYILQL
jgi:hypothetical protein